MDLSRLGGSLLTSPPPSAPSGYLQPGVTQDSTVLSCKTEAPWARGPLPGGLPGGGGCVSPQPAPQGRGQGDSPGWRAGLPGRVPTEGTGGLPHPPSRSVDRTPTTPRCPVYLGGLPPALVPGSLGDQTGSLSEGHPPEARCGLSPPPPPAWPLGQRCHPASSGVPSRCPDPWCCGSFLRRTLGIGQACEPVAGRAGPVLYSGHQTRGLGWSPGQHRALPLPFSGGN